MYNYCINNLYNYYHYYCIVLCKRVGQIQCYIRVVLWGLSDICNIGGDETGKTEI